MSQLIALIGLVLLTIGVFANTLNNAFHFDDFPNIVHHSTLQQAKGIGELWPIWPTRFINTLTLAFNYRLGGLDVQGYHVLSIVIHLLNGLLVFWLINLLFQSPALKSLKLKNSVVVAFLAAAIFLVHPLQTQPINYIYQRATLLAALFYLLSIVTWLKSCLVPQSSKQVMTYRVIAFLSGILGMLSKETVITLPITMTIVTLYLTGWGWRKSLSQLWPYFILVAVIPLVWLSQHPITDFIGPHQMVKNVYAGGMGSCTYFLTQMKVLVIYLQKLWVPINQTVEYDIVPAAAITENQVIAGGFLISALMMLAFYLRRRLVLVSLGITWFFLTIAPESSFWPNADLVFEHRLYLPLVGFVLVLVQLLILVCNNRRWLMMLAFVGSFMLVAIYSYMSIERNKVWRTEFSLWDDAVKKSPKASRVYLNRGAAYHQMGRLKEAMDDYNMVIGLGPVTAVTLSNRGSIFSQWGDYEHAKANFDLALKINPSYLGTYINRGRMYQAMGEKELAIADFREAMHLDPAHVSDYQYVIDLLSP